MQQKINLWASTSATQMRWYMYKYIEIKTFRTKFNQQFESIFKTTCFCLLEKREYFMGD